MQRDIENWDLIIEPKNNAFKFGLKDIWRYRDLLFLFVKRDFVATYKQTILGPIWFFIQPIITTVTFLIIFGNIAKISTDGLPSVLFYMSGIILWNYFADCLTKTSETFSANANIFGKVYFPRLIVPLSVVTSNLIKFSIQLILFVIIWFYFYFKGAHLQIHSSILLFPLLIILLAGHGFALGIIISSMTTKYRDLKFLLQFGVQLMMYATPVVYPLSSVPEKYRWLSLLNPMTSIIETFKYSILGTGFFSPFYLMMNCVLLLLIFFIGIMVFNKIEKSFMDTV